MAAEPKKDWPPAQIVAAVRMKGTNLRQLSIKNSYCESAGRVALQKPWPKVERIIADCIGVAPHEIWPTRYDAQGLPISQKCSTAGGRAHVQSGAAV